MRAFCTDTKVRVILIHDICLKTNVGEHRWETAQSVTHLVRRMMKNSSHLPSNLRLLDLCSGTGCIPLLFHHEFRASEVTSSIQLDSLGVDISSQAVDLAKRNLKQIQSQSDTSRDTTTFVQADIFSPSFLDDLNTSSAPRTALTPAPHVREKPRSFDILVSNPPYISPTAFRTTTSFSVRKYEPSLALVPDDRHSVPGVDRGDTFYPHLLRIADQVGAKIVLFEVADMEEALRVARMVEERDWGMVEIWRDEPAVEGKMDEILDGVRVRGAGKGRSVFACRAEGRDWVGH